MQAAGRFEAIDFENMTVAHTHAEVDQRFSIVGTKIAAAPCLEDPSDVKKVIEDGLKPINRATLHVELLHHTFNFQEMFSQFHMKISGLASVPRELSTNHVWRFIPRRVLSQIGFVRHKVVSLNRIWASLKADRPIA